MNWPELMLALLTPPVAVLGWAALFRRVLHLPYNIPGGWFFIGLTGVIIGSVQSDWAWLSGTAVLTPN